MASKELSTAQLCLHFGDRVRRDDLILDRLRYAVSLLHVTIRELKALLGAELCLRKKNPIKRPHR
jgi:hypothetical protein